MKLNTKMKQGFTVLEMVIAIFLIAVVIGTALLIMAANLNVIDKSNDIIVANALIQYTVEDIANIEFPPVYYDRQYDFGDRIVIPNPAPPPDDIYKGPEGTEYPIDPKEDGADWMPLEFPEELQNKYILRRYDFLWDNDGNLFTDATDTNDKDKAAKHSVDIYVLNKKDKKVILKQSVIISRD